jgi:wobble nucleotide-excising tRNase
MKKIKLQSRYQGEERIFIWCFSYIILKRYFDRYSRRAHFIDDPVSSMDEHNIFTTAESIVLIDDTYPKRKIILTTHHIGSFSILADRLKKGQKSENTRTTAVFLLENGNDELKLNNQNGAFCSIYIYC